MAFKSTRTPILIGKSGAGVYKVHREDGVEWIEKSGSSEELSLEAAVINWCLPHLPVPTVIASEVGVLTMSLLPGVNLTEVSMQCAVTVLTEALRLIHEMPVRDCPFQADW